DIADYVLMHDRDIYLRGDDSVFIHLAGKNRPIRRSRGYAPMPILVKSNGPPILAVGGELKNTICLLQYNRAFISQHIGDLKNLEAYNFFRMTIDHLQKIFDTRPELIVHDLHPRYLSTQWAKEQIDVPLLGAQHHHAHLAAVMAEHGIERQVLGIIMDGTGYSNDGTIWGGEILLGDYSGFKRLAAFEPMLLPGGDAAIRAPWRTAVSYLLQSEGELPALPFLSEHDYKPIVDIVEKNVSCFATSSCGRLFDAVAAMSGGRQIIHYEGQAAIELMQSSDNVSAESFKYEFSQQGNLKLMLVKPLIRAVVKAIQAGCDLGEIGSRFHRTLCAMLSTIIQQLRRKYDINTVVVSGGVFQNQILFEALIEDLETAKFSVFSHEKVPTNDGGIALGQALIGRKYLENLRQ
ncbi:MAG: carbamoyltransferase HypF, partial [Candidatus Marinimicrobia bacterium]|nr:carbamoyltransferase HypF [Candidatus Neomarinimicrobiota bacterium]